MTHTDGMTWALRLGVVVLWCVGVAALSAIVPHTETAHAESPGVIYVVDNNCCTTSKGGIIRVDTTQANGSNQTVVSSGQNFSEPLGLVLAADGKLYAIDNNCCSGNTGAVIRVDPSLPNGSNQTIVSSGQHFIDPTGIAQAADGKLYVTDPNCCGGVGGVILVDPTLPNGSNQTILSSGQHFDLPARIALAPNGKLYVTDTACCGAAPGGLIEVDPTLPNGSNQTVISSGQSFNYPFGVTAASDGRIYVVSGSTSTARVIRVDPTLPDGSNQTVISSEQNMLSPTGIAEAPDGRFYVTEPFNGNLVIAVDPTGPSNNNQTVISSGQNLADPANVVVVPEVSIASASATEGSAISFAISLRPWLSRSVVVGLATTNGTATYGADFIPEGTSVTFGPNETSKTAIVQTVSDTLDEANETFTLAAVPPSALATAGPATGTILDDDPAPSLAIADTSVLEGNTGTVNAAFIVTLSPQSGQTVTVQYAAGTGSAQVTADLDATNGTLTFLAGETIATILVPVIGDRIPEADESFTVALSSPTAASLARNQATGLILNDDVTVSIADATVGEGNSGTTAADFSVTLSRPSSETVTVQYLTASGSATSGTDFQAGSGTVTFQPDETSKTVSVAVTGDAMVEPDETYTVTLSDPSGATLARNQATGTIVNDDTSVSISDATRAEGHSGTTPATFTVALSEASHGVVSVQFATAGGTATSGTDFQSSSGSLTFQPGESSKPIAITILGDATVEQDETFTVTLTNPIGAVLARSQATGLIVNDDASLAVADAVVTETTGTFTTVQFTVTLSQASSQTVSVQYATASASATAGADFQAASGTLTFQPGQTSRTVPVAILGDIEHEEDETFTLTLSTANGAVLGRATASARIVDNDPVQACVPRPRVTRSPTANGGGLVVHVESTPLNTQQNNPLQSLRFDALDGATVTMDGRSIAAGQTIVVAPNTVGATFTVRRVTPGQPATVHLTIVDGCGTWKTFVGGGSDAGF